ncbi:hypothetical protein HK101_008748 [Irineochytrium annulatum]|nr:hypothetical protein HK101_008748 [Irineochytrium annulatum]
MSSVITGEFSGWNGNLTQGGFAGMTIATWVAAVLYLGLALCLAEMATSIPVLGGSFAFSRAVCGIPMAFFVGNTENLEYNLFFAAILVGMSSLICETADIDHAYHAPYIWVAILTVFVVLIVFCNKLSWDLMAWLNVVCIVQIAAFCVFVAASAMFDPAEAVDGVGVIVDPAGATFNALLPTGLFGVMACLPSAVWWFTGFEVIVLASNETEKPSKSIPSSLLISWGLLYGCAAALLVFCVMTAPGNAAISSADYPMLAVFSVKYGPLARKFSILYVAHPKSRRFTPSLSLTSENIPIPWRATLYFAGYGLAEAVFAVYFKGLGNVDPYQLLLQMTVCSAIMNYVGIGIVYIWFSVKHPDAPRPFRSPLGISGAVVTIAICLVILISHTMASYVFQVTLVSYTIKMISSGWYFLTVGRLNLLPTEDCLIHAIWCEQAERAKLCYAADVIISFTWYDACHGREDELGTGYIAGNDKQPVPGTVCDGGWEQSADR